MGQIIDRLSRVLKSEFSDKSSQFNSSFESKDDELKRIIDELSSSKQKADNSEHQNSTRNEAPPQSNNAMTLAMAQAILGVLDNATNEEIKAAYIKKVKEYHPDKVAMLGDELKALAEKKTQEINSAYSFMKTSKGI